MEIADGAIWIWNLADQQFSLTTNQIVDFYYARNQHFCDPVVSISAGVKIDQ